VAQATKERELIRAQARYVRSSARKARLVLEHIRGLSAIDAQAVLAFQTRAVARDAGKVLKSAIANAETNNGFDADELVVVAAFADEGPTLKRWRPRARGRVNRIRKRTCHITITVSPALPGEIKEQRRARPARAVPAPAPAETPAEETVAEEAAAEETTAKPKPRRTRKPKAEAAAAAEATAEEAQVDEAAAAEVVAEDEPAAAAEEAAEEEPVAEAEPVAAEERAAEEEAAGEEPVAGAEDETTDDTKKGADS
jgi:large subunit ribosomal protein L22